MPVSQSTTEFHQLLLPLTVLTRYLFFLSRRPVSASNVHFRNHRIAALQKLGPLLRERDCCELENIARQLSSLTPESLFRVAPEIQRELREVAALKIPRDVLLSQRSPSDLFFQDISRVLMIFGPGIGIGDEILCFGLPEAISRVLPSAEVNVISMYEGLWNCVAGSRTIETYRDAPGFLGALRRGKAPHDVVFLIDFESPGLVPAICREQLIPRYVELSLGRQSVLVLDNRTRRLCRSPESSVENFYHGLARLLSWLHGAATLPDLDSVVTRTKTTDSPRDLVTILVSPFTSKENPSERYWSDLLTNIVPRAFGRRVRFIVDTGPNSRTESFARSLVQSASAQPFWGASCEIAHSAGERFVSLDRMWHEVENADALLIADSFLAHAAGRLGRPAFVIARPGLERWTVPSPLSFYFRAKDSALTVAGAIRLLLGEHLQTSSDHLPIAAKRKCRQLAKSSIRLRHAFSSFAPSEELLQEWSGCRACYCDVVAGIHSWPEEFSPLFSDHDYGELWPSCLPDLDPLTGDEDRAEMRKHLEMMFHEWENSNLNKYIHLGHGG
ncbi:MAG: hypothetical protein JO108_15500 [Acidobacteriaceae bacterium]|nr:hypothetical protein [Acidobacteriaceae bacterium]